MATTISKVQFKSDSSQLQRDLKGIQSKTDNVSKAFGKLKTAIAGIAIGAFIKSNLDAADSLGKVADKVGLTVSQLQELRYAADLSGVSANALDTSMQRFSRRIGEAANGTGVLLKELDGLGISIRNNDGSIRSTNDIFNDYTSAIASATSEQEKLRLAVAAFDSEGAGLVNMLSNGSDGLAEMRREAQELNIVLGENQVRAAERANDAISRVVAQFRTLSQVVVAELAPDIENLATTLSNLTKDKDFIKDVADSFRLFGEGIKFATELLKGLVENFKLVVGFAIASKVAQWSGAFSRFSKSVHFASKALISQGPILKGLAVSFAILGRGIFQLVARFVPIVAVVQVAIALFTDFKGIMLGLSESIVQGAKKLGIYETELDSLLQKIEAFKNSDVGIFSLIFGGERDIQAGTGQTLDEYFKNLYAKKAELAKQAGEVSVDALGSELDAAIQLDAVNRENYKRKQEELAQLKESALAFLPLQRAQEDYRIASEKIQQAYDAGVISQELYLEGLARVGETYDDAVASASGFTDQMDSHVQAQEEWNQALRETVANLASEGNELDSIRKLRESINTAIANGIVIEKDGAAALATLAKQEKELLDQQLKDSRKWSDGWKVAFDDYVDNATNAAQRAKDTFNTITRGMEDTLLNFFKTGKFEWQNFVQSIIDMLLQSQVQQLIANVFGGLSPNSSGSSFSLGNLLGFANGGIIPTNGPVVVGERGPELLMGASGSRVVPNGQFGGGAVTYNINAVDAQSFKQMVARDPAFLYAVTEQGRRKLPGGA